MALTASMELDITTTDLTREGLQEFVDNIPPGAKITTEISKQFGDYNQMDTYTAKIRVEWTMGDVHRG